MSYRVEVQTRALRELGRLPADIREAITGRISGLAENPRPPGVKALTADLKGSYRLTVREDYRVGYDVDDRARSVIVWQIGHRSRFYEAGKRRRR
jgi:mRNA interferase RelE/StbE